MPLTDVLVTKRSCGKNRPHQDDSAAGAAAIVLVLQFHAATGTYVWSRGLRGGASKVWLGDQQSPRLMSEDPYRDGMTEQVLRCTE